MHPTAVLAVLLPSRPFICLFAQFKPHIAYLLRPFNGLERHLFIIVRGIAKTGPRQPVHSTLIGVQKLRHLGLNRTNKPSALSCSLSSIMDSSLCFLHRHLLSEPAALSERLGMTCYYLHINT